MADNPSRVANRGVFVTGTDTGVGKTLVACALLRAFAQSGLRTVGMKPVATGCRTNASDRANDDVAALIEASSVAAPTDLINPYCFEPAIAPNLAAQQAGCRISLKRIRECHLSLASLADCVIVEGAGGLLAPLNQDEDFGDLARLLELPVVLVVGMRLGCLNHALLTAAAIRGRGLAFAGWVANRIDPAMPFFEDNLAFLEQKLPAPLIAILPFAPQTAQASAAMNVDLLAARHA